MPTYQNITTKTIVYNGTSILPNSTLTIDKYLEPYWISKGLQLIDHEPAVSPIIDSYSGALSAGSQKVFDIPWQTQPIQLYVLCASGAIDIYFNTTTTPKARVSAGQFIKLDKLESPTVNRIIIEAVSNSNITAVISIHIPL